MRSQDRWTTVESCDHLTPLVLRKVKDTYVLSDRWGGNIHKALWYRSYTRYQLRPPSNVLCNCFFVLAYCGLLIFNSG